MILRVWPALAAWGAGLVHIAAGAGAPFGWAIALVATGALELAWGVVALRSDRLRRPAVVLAAAVGCLGLTLAAALALALGWVPLLGASGLLLIVAVLAGVELRRTDRARAAGGAERPATSRPRPWRTLVGFAAGAVIVAALTTPSLAATPAGHDAVPHGELHGHTGH
jgi:hypothetical protein